ncbi:hypothetical protein Mapa_015269 [Marchantia paleacea]|nr:hypothetical protein Mapa_015269 [Marchantia paleacea]
MVFLGLVGVVDPPRPESKLSVEQCYEAGITVHMLTGDHHDTAMAIAKEVGIIPVWNSSLHLRKAAALSSSRRIVL